MKTVTVIIDFDNFFREGIASLNSQSLEYALSELVLFCEGQYKDVAKIDIRLYGGWHQEHNMTKQASTLQQMLVDVNLFPKIKNKKILNGTVELASELIGIPGFTWDHTYKITDGMKAFRINSECDDTVCALNKSTCPKYMLSHLTKHKERKCDQVGCTNIHKAVFKNIEQKMVDTIIACDILTIIEHDNFRGMVVISDDQDLFPSLALADEKRKSYPNRRPDEIILGIQNEEKIDFITNFLNPFKIQTVQL